MKRFVRGLGSPRAPRGGGQSSAAGLAGRRRLEAHLVFGGSKIIATDSDPPCETMLRTVCGAAKRAGKGNCFICTGQHQQAMMQVHCTQSDFDLFCT